MQLSLAIATEIIPLTPEITQRAKVFESSGLQAFDALHLACAETQADVLLTVDDKFLKKTTSLSNLRIRISNPLKWLEEMFA